MSDDDLTKTAERMCVLFWETTLDIRWGWNRTELCLHGATVFACFLLNSAEAREILESASEQAAARKYVL